MSARRSDPVDAQQDPGWAEAQLRAVFDHTDQGLVLVDPAGRFLHWNRAARALYGLDAAAESGAPFREFTGIYELTTLAGEPLPPGEWPIARILRGESLHNLELAVHNRGEGWCRTFSYGGSLVRDDAGRARLALLTVSDVSERRRAEEALRESESFYRQTLESIPGMVFTTRPDGFCDYQSQQWVDYTGVPMGEHLGEGWSRLLHPDDRARALAAWQAAVAGIADYDLEYRVRRHDGAYEWFRVIARPLRDAAGRMVRWFGVAMNIESLKRSEELQRGNAEAARLLNAELEEFAYVVSHDLKAPLRAVANLAYVVNEESERLDDENRRRLLLMRERVMVMDQLIDGLLTCARLGHGARAPAAVPLAPFVRELVATLPVPPGFRIELLEPLPTLAADPIELRQLFQNLIANAMCHHHEPQRGHLSIRAEDEGGAWLIELADNGPGIPAHLRPRLFRMFATAAAGRPGHTGIGLAVVRKIVRGNGGEIEVADNHPRGARFRLRWPK